MGSVDFESFIDNEIQEEVASKSIDWEAKKEFFITNLDSLYRDIKEYLKKYTEEDKIKIFEGVKGLNEEFIGTYSAPTLSIEFGLNRVELLPIGTNLIGARGRVDVSSGASRQRLVLVAEIFDKPNIKVTTSVDGDVISGKVSLGGEGKPETKFVWKIATLPPRIAYLELNEDTFLSLLMEVVGA